MAASAISRSSSSVYRVPSPSLEGQSANNAVLAAVLSTLALMRAAMAQPFASLMAEPEIKLKGCKPFVPGLVIVSGAPGAAQLPVVPACNPASAVVTGYRNGRKQCPLKGKPAGHRTVFRRRVCYFGHVRVSTKY